MEELKRGYLPILQGICIFKDMCPKTQIERDRLERIPYTLTIGSIIYVMICIRPYVSYALIITSRYQSNTGESMKDSLKTLLST
jgi:hypothetical protein